MGDFTESCLTEAAEQIDAAMFSGDAFIQKANREALQWYMDRWSREMKNHAETLTEEK